MFGLIADFTAQPGKREELIKRMVAGSRNMPGCISYIVHRDPVDEDKIWVTEVWDTKESSKRSVNVPTVAAAIDGVMPLILRLGHLKETEPVGGHGL